MGCLFAVLMAASTLVWSTGIGGWAGYAGAGVFYAVWMFGVLRWRHWRSARPRTPTA